MCLAFIFVCMLVYTGINIIDLIPEYKYVYVYMQIRCGNEN